MLIVRLFSFALVLLWIGILAQEKGRSVEQPKLEAFADGPASFLVARFLTYCSTLTTYGEGNLDQHHGTHEQLEQEQRQQGKQGKQHNTVLYIVRHTDVHNPNDVLYGRLPRFGLSDLGRQQAARTATVLSEVPVDAFYSSPQLRARQTARTLAAAHGEMPVRVSSLLAEVRTAWQGRPHSELETLHFDFYNNPLDDADEKLNEVWDRINRFVRRVRRRHPGQTVVGVTHGDIVFLSKSGFRGMPIAIESIRRRDFYPGKGSLTRLTFSNDLSLDFPLRVEYYDPNSEDRQWNQDWVTLEPVSEEARQAAGPVARDAVV